MSKKTISNGVNKKELLQIKQDLEKQKKEIKERFLEFAESNPLGKDNYDVKFPQFGQTEDENADEVEDYSNMLPIKIGLEETLANIEVALKKIEEGNYGICENCGKEIPLKRLKVAPAARLCLNCEKKIKE